MIVSNAQAHWLQTALLYFACLLLVYYPDVCRLIAYVCIF